MKIRKIIFILFLMLIPKLIIVCNSQDNYYIYGTWLAVKGEFITSLSHKSKFEPKFKSDDINVSELRFFFDESTVKLNKSFEKYSTDKSYKWIFKNSIYKNQSYSERI